MQSYEHKTSTYFSFARREIEPLLPKLSRAVLEVGCGSGETLAWLRETGRCESSVGLELFPDAAARARQHADEVIIGDAEGLIDSGALGAQTFDLILCLDVLEHMTDPWSFLRKVTKHLAPTGTLIASIPNVQNAKVVLPLLLLGQWEYQDAGILDRTHLRFFTRSSAIALVRQARLRITRVAYTMPDVGSIRWLLNIVTLGLFRSFVRIQFLISAVHDESRR